MSANTPSLCQVRLARWCRSRRVRLVSWIQDCYGLAAYRILSKKLPGVGHLAGRYMMALDRESALASDAVVVITDDFVPYFERNGVSKSRIHVIQNWAPLESLPLAKKSNQWATLHGLSPDRVRFLYSGTLSIRHDADLLVQLGVKLQEWGNGELVVVSEGPAIDAVRQRAAELGLRSVHCFPFQPFEQMSSVLGSADVLVSILDRDAGVYCVPSKVLSYMCAGRAQLVAMPSENLAARIVQRHGIGAVSRPEQAAQFLENAHALFLDEERRNACGAAARAFAEAHFDLDEICNRFERILAQARCRLSWQLFEPASDQTKSTPFPSLGAKMSDRVIVIGGGGGFIGGYLAGHLKKTPGAKLRVIDIKPLNEWYQLHPEAENIQADLKDPLNCQNACEDATDVYNLACDMGGMGFIENNRALCMISVLVNTNMLIAARDAKVSRYFYSSSACVYNAEKQRSPDVVALKEEDAYPAMPEDGYGWEKLFSERMCRHFREDFGMRTCVARFHNVYGPNGTWDGGREKAPAAICRKVIEAVTSGNHEIEIWGDGRQTRSFMYIDDCIAGIDKIVDNEIPEPINLGSSELVTINQLVDIVEDIANVKLKRRYDLSAPKGVNGRNSDNTLIQSYLGWEPSIPLRTGLQKTYEWIYDQYTAKYGADSPSKGILAAT